MGMGLGVVGGEKKSFQESIRGISAYHALEKVHEAIGVGGLLVCVLNGFLRFV